jgi:Flp pilus assembly pilin Flp
MDTDSAGAGRLNFKYRNESLGRSRLSRSGHTIASVPKMKALFALHTFRSGQRGQGQVEYGLILMLIAITVIATLLLLGESVHSLYHNVSNAMPK